MKDNSVHPTPWATPDSAAGEAGDAARPARPRVTEQEVVAEREGIARRLHAAYVDLARSMRGVQAQWNADPVSALLRAAREGDCTAGGERDGDRADVFAARTWSNLGDSIGDATASVYYASETYAYERYRFLQDDVNLGVDDPDDMLYRFAWWETCIDEGAAACLSGRAPYAGRAAAAAHAGRSLDDPAGTGAASRPRGTIVDALALIARGDMDAIETFAARLVGAVDPELSASVQAGDNVRVVLELMADHETALTYATYVSLVLEAVPPNVYVALAGRDGACLLVEIALLLVTALLNPGAAAAARLSALAGRVAAAGTHPAAVRRRSAAASAAIDAYARLLDTFAHVARDLHPLGTKLGLARTRGLPDAADAATILALKKQAAKRDMMCRVCGSFPHAPFCSAAGVVTDLHAKLTALDLPGVCTHPAVYIGDDGVRHEGYWYLTFPERFDCWDREASDVEQDDPPLQLGDVTLHQVYGYRLNATLLDATPLRERLLFKMGGTLDAFVVCHASLRSLFEGAHAGVELQAVADY